jgi:ABC-type nitrate/sulfonate/bicarbonate transport system substrate-binding protein
MSKFRTPEAPAPAPLIWYARCPTLTALGLIANRGVLQREFLRENVHLVSVRENSTPGVRQGHLDHSLPNLIREADAATALWAHGQNARSRLLAIGQTYHSVSVVTRSGQPIQSLRDLIGRRLGLIKEAGNFSPAQVRSLRAWETVLDVAGIAKSDIEFVPVVADHPSVPFGDVARREVEALLGGQSDVAILFGAKGLELARSAHLKEVHRFTADEIRNDPRLAGLVELRAVTVDQVLLEGREDIVTRILTNLIEAGRWAQTFPKEALKQAAIEGKVEITNAETAYGAWLAEGARIGFEPERVAALESLQDWLKSRHLLPESHQIGQWAEPGVLQVAKENLRVVA